MEKSHLALVAPTTVIGTVADRPRQPLDHRDALVPGERGVLLCVGF
jgi:hypothetical protein